MVIKVQKKRRNLSSAIQAAEMESANPRPVLSLAGSFIPASAPAALLLSLVVGSSSTQAWAGLGVNKKKFGK